MLRNIWRRITLRRALNAMGREDYDRASRLFTLLIRRFPQDRGLHYNRGLCHLAHHKISLAEEDLLQELQLTEKGYAPLRALGDLCYFHDRPAEAVQWMKQAITCCAGQKERRQLELRIVAAQSTTTYKNALRAQKLFQQATTLLNEGNWRQARELLDEARRHDAHDPLINNNLGVIALNHERDYSKAHAFFLKASRYSDLPIITRNLNKTARALEAET